ncbi:MAG: hypothetical protein AAFX39_01230 [Pseudomonadota bacterium]
MKTAVFSALLVFNVLLGFLDIVYVNPDDSFAWIVASTLIFNILALYWVYKDAHERGRRRPEIFIIASMVVLPIIGFPIYMIMTRGFLQGSVIFILVTLAIAGAFLLGGFAGDGYLAMQG